MKLQNLDWSNKDWKAFRKKLKENKNKEITYTTPSAVTVVISHFKKYEYLFPEHNPGQRMQSNGLTTPLLFNFN